MVYDSGIFPFVSEKMEGERRAEGGREGRRKEGRRKRKTKEKLKKTQIYV
jgi:hypothetical protein